MRFRIVEDPTDTFMNHTRKLVERDGLFGWTRWHHGKLLPSGYKISTSELIEKTSVFYNGKKREITQFLF